jgi:hypothetical protein
VSDGKEKTNVMGDKLRRHAKNVRIAANDCDEYVSMLQQVKSEDPVAQASRDNLIEKEHLKKSCLVEAAEYMEHVADSFSGGVTN